MFVSDWQVERMSNVAIDVKNVMELFVEMNLDQALQETPDACRCDQCRADIKALILNKLKPMYVSTSQGEVMGKLHAFDTGKQVEFLCCYREAVEKVMANPHHDR